MDQVGAYEAKTHLPRLLQRVARGERIVITRHGVPIAVLQPFDPSAVEDVDSAINALREFRKEKTLGDADLREFIEEGRR